MKNLTNWLNADKTSLNVEKTELVIFKDKSKNLERTIKIKVNRKRLYPSKLVKYLGFAIDDNLNWKDQIHDIPAKVNREIWVVIKIRSDKWTSFSSFSNHEIYKLL